MFGCNSAIDIGYNATKVLKCYRYTYTQYGVWIDGVIITYIACVLYQEAFLHSRMGFACFISKCDLEGGIKKGDLEDRAKYGTVCVS